MFNSRLDNVEEMITGFEHIRNETMQKENMYQNTNEETAIKTDHEWAVKQLKEVSICNLKPQKDEGNGKNIWRMVTKKFPNLMKTYKTSVLRGSMNLRQKKHEENYTKAQHSQILNTMW